MSAPPWSARTLPPSGAALNAAALLREGDGRPALYLAATARTLRLTLHRLPDDCRVQIEVPHPLPADIHRHPLKGARVIFENPSGRAVLHLHTPAVAREVLAALEAYAQARRQWEDAQPAPFTGQPRGAA